MKSAVVRIGFPAFVWAVFVGFCWIGVIRPVSNWTTTQIKDRDALIVQNGRLQQTLVRLENDLNAIKFRNTEDLVWESVQIGSTTARIQQSINQLAVAQGIRMRSVAPGQSTLSNIGEAIGFRLEFEAHLNQLTAFLRAVESNAPLLVIAQTKVRRLARQNSESQQPLLFVQMDISVPIQSLEENEASE